MTRSGTDSAAVAQAPSPERHDSGLPLRILVAEDNEFNRDLLEYMLAGQGLSATMVVDGREALASWSANSSTCCSWTSTCRNWTASRWCEAIRKRERTAGGHLPVIALTARSRKGGPRAVPAGRHGRIPHQAVQGR